ncbi:Hsp20/alpha crystallin family protein [Belnapia rosea]|uniref:HSP20 family protein n=1 Tax=Belnapia rosea TaxID=938405 RepID=A0A1G7D826_9PROT|nr:Hsp20/alpha crystallin family protein [Belnapia rosea]SDE46915.1 HSP20 family protein [Belnapia rosea]
MMMSDLTPWGRNRTAPVPSGNDENNPFLALQREMNRVFDSFLRGSLVASTLAPLGWTATGPHVEVSETEQEVRIVAELPGLEEKDLAVTLHDGVLILSGEKKAESSGAVYSERWHGQFQRSLQLGPDVDPDKVAASFRNGVLTVTVAKRPEAQRQVKRIPISG